MKTKIRYAIITFFVLIMVALSIGLPSGIFAIQDKNIIGKVNLEQQNMPSINYQQPLSIMKKIELVGNSSLKSLALDQGKSFDQESVQEAARNEIKTLEKLGVFPNISNEINFQECTAELYISTDQPSKSLILWNIRFYNENGYGTIAIDDETGKVLMFMISKLVGVPLYELSLSTAQAWGTYLGFTVKESAIKPTGNNSNNKNTFQMVTYTQNNDTLMFNIIKQNSGYSFGLSSKFDW